MKMNIAPHALYRIPQFSYRAQLKDCWPQLLGSISLSSEEFYKVVAHLDFEDLAGQHENIGHTLWKYFNRAKFRSTPYASFASIGMASLQKGGNHRLKLIDRQQLHTFYNWPVVEKVEFAFDQLVEWDVKLWANHTWYTVGDDIRYAGQFIEGYMLVDVQASADRIAVLQASRVPQPISALLTGAGNRVERKQLLTLLDQMLEEQLLFCDLHPNIIGEDYFKRIGFYSQQPEAKYIIAQRKVEVPSLDNQVFRHLPELLTRLQQMLPSYYSTELDAFKMAFLKRFGQREVALMVALDPETGVGYANMPQQAQSDELIERLAALAGKRKEESQTSTLNRLLPFLVGNGTSEIDLETVPVPKIDGNSPLPNTVPVLCTVVDGTIYAEHMGGATANSLLGRFTHVDDQVHQATIDNAAIEAAANPDVDFFDVGYLVGNHVDNVNRRRAIYPLQLNLLNYDTSQNPLLLDDLLVSVHDGQLMLRHRTSLRRLVPKLATAYNYMLSDLPVFRFLCDLQNQGIHKNLHLRLRDHIPGLDYYPRVRFRNIILSTSAWKLEWSRFQNLAPQLAVSVLAEQLQFWGVTAQVRSGNSDQTLMFDTSDMQDLWHLLRVLKKEGQLYLEEMALPREPVFLDGTGSPYLPQFILSCYHQQKIYAQYVPSRINGAGSHRTEIHMPGQDWIYSEIFCHPIRSDVVLKEHIEPFIEANSARIEKWFFIRYSEGGNHIRLRLKLVEKHSAAAILDGLNVIMAPLLSCGLVSDMVIRPYWPETERYGKPNMRLVEDHFHIDSSYVLSFISAYTGRHDGYHSCLQLLSGIAESGLFVPLEFAAILAGNSAGFNSEHQLGPSEFKEMNAYVKEFWNSSTLQDIQGHDRLLRSFLEVLGAYTESERPAILSALFHMHVNRLFAQDQRTHETMVYYLACKQQHRLANQPVT